MPDESCAEKLGGMHESSEPISVPENHLGDVVKIVLTTAYLSNISIFKVFLLNEIYFS